VLDSLELQGQVPETIVSGQTADISPFVEYALCGKGVDPASFNSNCLAAG
jgi:hypothetical protein